MLASTATTRSRPWRPPDRHRLLADDDDGAVFQFAQPACSLHGGRDPRSFYSIILPSATGFAIACHGQGAVHIFGTPSTTAPCLTFPPRRQGDLRYTSLAPERRPSRGRPAVDGGNSSATVTQTGRRPTATDARRQRAVYPSGRRRPRQRHRVPRRAPGRRPRADADYGGYWIVDDIGRVFAFGDASTKPATPTPPRSPPGRR